jgi:hypothetical protein
MLTQKPKPQFTTVRVKIQQYRGSKYEGGKCITLYDTTAAQVENLIQRTVKNGGSK